LISPSRWVGTLAAIGLCAGMLSACGSSHSARSKSPQTVEYLFSIPTTAGSLVGPDDQHLTLRLIGTRDYLTRFTDRPLRGGFVVANADFARRFNSYFSGSNPNAVLTYTPRGSRIPVSVVLTVGHARWDSKSMTWTFAATRIRKQTDNLPDTTVHIQPPLIPNPRALAQGTLFIDSARCCAF
jgi:hypothetical protein